MINRVLSVLVCLVIVLALTACTSASADVIRTFDSTIVGNIGSLSLHAEVSLDSGIYTYFYHVTNDNAATIPSYFGVWNPNDAVFFNPTNSKNFTDPSYLRNDYLIEWANDNILLDETVTFSYQSYAAPVSGTLDSYVLGGIDKSGHGQTLALGPAPVPEPSSIAGLALPLMGMAGMFIRRRR